MTEAEDSGTQEAAEGSERADDESPEGQYRDHATSRNAAYESGKARENKTAAKKTGRIGSLEKAVSRLDAGADSAGCQNTSLPRNLAEYVEAAHSANSDEDKDTPNGAVAIIYHQDKKTGELEFLFEEKPLDYPVPEARGKLSLVGGAIQAKEKSLEALVRELAEEIEEPAASIVIESLRMKDSFYQRMPYEYMGIKGYSDIYVIEIKKESSWNAVKQAAFKHDAGIPRVLKQNEMHVDDFAFGYGEIAKRFADANSKSGSKKFAHFLYADSAYMATSLPSLYSPKYLTNRINFTASIK